jgi:hypothetical protein
VAASETATFIEGGGALIIGTVEADGTPCAARGWGIAVLPGGGHQLRVRVLLDASDRRALQALDTTGAMSVTSTDVRTLRSIQIKGEATPLGVATEEDLALARTYCEAFFEAIQDADGIARSLLERLVPGAYVAYEVTVHDRFDQTPGPGAGAAILPRHA